MLLDEIMSKDDQRKSGVAYLTPNQRSALEVWINKNCNCSEKNIQPEQQPLFLSINIDNGRKIQLSDDTVWEVDPRDYPTSEAWLTPIPIKIIPSNDPNYPSLLVNKNTGVSVKVRKAELMTLPPPQAPQPMQPGMPAPAPAQPSAPSSQAPSMTAPSTQPKPTTPAPVKPYSPPSPQAPSAPSTQPPMPAPAQPMAPPSASK
jgi:hypothetical protein